MHCKCCDKQLSEKELNWNADLDDWELCTTCLDISLDAAYSNGFLTEDDEFVIVDDWDTQDLGDVQRSFTDYRGKGYYEDAMDY